jgi:dTDP-glucose pyrophosphorylase
MQGVILAAGKGSRLHPITLRRSKAMLPVLGKPIVERVMLDMVANGVENFILVVRPDDPDITRFFRHESDIKADIRFVYQPQPLGMSNALLCAAPLIRGDFILSACDNLISTEHIGRMIDAWHGPSKLNALLTLMAVVPDRLESMAVVEMDGPWIRSIIEKPRPGEAPSNISSLPLYCFSLRILDYAHHVRPSPRGEYELQDAIQMLIDHDGLVGGVFCRRRLTLTHAADLLEINRHYLTGGSDRPQIAPASVGPGTELVNPLCIESGTIIGDHCVIGPNVYVERGCRIGDNVIIRNAVMLRESVIEGGSLIVDQVVP